MSDHSCRLWCSTAKGSSYEYIMPHFRFWLIHSFLFLLRSSDSQPLSSSNHPDPLMGSLGSMCLTHPYGLSLSSENPTCLLKKKKHNHQSFFSQLCPYLQFSNYHYLTQLCFFSIISFFFFMVPITLVLFTSPILEVKSGQEKNSLCCSFCLALSFSHFLRHIFPPSYPLLQFLFF